MTPLAERSPTTWTLRALLVLAWTTAALVCAAQAERYETLTLPNPGGVSTTNLIAIAEGETAELVGYSKSLVSRFGSALYLVSKNGLVFAVNYDSDISSILKVVKGPAMVGVSSRFESALVTLRITPSSYDANKTVILPPGTNQVSVALEASTNLVSWTTATNGLYGSTNSAHFFRIRVGGQN
jgi:hypothetical protein